jgi:transposase-like protein
MSNRKETSGTNPEVVEKAKRRRFEAAYKLRVLEEADRCIAPGLLGELLRREGLYSSHLATWRRQREAGALDALGPKKRGRKPKRKDAVALENERLARENKRLAERLRQAEVIIEVQKKVSEMLGISTAKTNDDGRN